MCNLRQRALAATRESKQIEFKSEFDPNSPRAWCEIIKDIVAFANSGGGIVVFGLDDSGNPLATDVTAICIIDPADMTNKLSRYIGTAVIEVEVCELEKAGHKLAAFVIEAVETPVVFQRHGAYETGAGKPTTVFAVGTVYFRHGGKSEPGTSDDIRKAIENRVNTLRKDWMRGLKTVVQAPRGSQILVASPRKRGFNQVGALPTAAFRVVSDVQAPAVRLTRDKTLATSTLVHEEMTEGIFDEINNLIDANRLLAEGQMRFCFDASVYYRIYAQRNHVARDENDFLLLLRAAVFDFHAPCLFWVCQLPARVLAELLVASYLHPRGFAVKFLIRLALILDGDFADWLGQRWDQKWGNRSQPPQFYWTFRRARKEAESLDPLLVITRLREQMRIDRDSGAASVTVAEMLAEPKLAGELLSKVSMDSFRLQGKDGAVRSLARNLDCLAYGTDVQSSAAEVYKLVLELAGDQEPGEPGEPQASENESNPTCVPR